MGLSGGLLKAAVFVGGRLNPRAFCALSPRYLINYHFLLEVFSDHLPQPETPPLKFSHHCLLLSFTTICHYLVYLLTFITQLEGKFPREQVLVFRCLEL